MATSWYLTYFHFSFLFSFHLACSANKIAIIREKAQFNATSIIMTLLWHTGIQLIPEGYTDALDAINFWLI